MLSSPHKQFLWLHIMLTILYLNFSTCKYKYQCSPGKVGKMPHGNWGRTGKAHWALHWEADLLYWALSSQVPTSTCPSSANPTNTQTLQGKTLGKAHTGKNSNNSKNKPVIHSRELLRITVRSRADTKRRLPDKTPVASPEKEAGSSESFFLFLKKKF